MAFTLLVVALALLNNGQDAPEQLVLDEEGILYYKTGEIDKNNELLQDYRKYEILEKVPFLGYKEYKISKGKPFRDGTAITDASFYLVQETGFETRKTSAALTTDEKACKAVKYFHSSGIYAQLGYSLYGKDNVDVAPSITYLLANYPTKATFKELNKTDVVTVLPALTCGNYLAEYTQYLEFVLYKAGFTGADCYPNTIIPTDLTVCSNTGTNKKYFQNFKEAAFKGNSDTIKDVLIRYGAVRLYDGTVIVGWDGADWVTVIEKPIPGDEPDPVDPPVERNVEEEPDVPDVPDLNTYQYVLDKKPISTYTGVVQGFVYNNGFTALRAALGLIAAVLVLPALLL
ncbi:MAG: hypothetical protein EZS28_013880 [Streblomastix strix]|uniref:Uncharacterized protein n=1 Tax=Streblomastix strix TaxID=222440 RepID=A0A5J4W7P6_9EUKA|nr:MAG: hypothetical protein EZS28_013880 [Streblomastix strix]